MDQQQQKQQPRFVISASEAESMLHSQSFTNLTHLLPSLVKPSLSLARPPISNFPVAAVGLGSSGRIFIGVNLEFPGLPLHHSVHAEQFLVTNLSLHSDPLLLSFSVSAAPCGHCRQFLQELPLAPDITIHILNHDTTTTNNNNTFTPLSHFLSHHFGPRDLLPIGSPLLLQPRHNNLTLNNTLNGFPPIPDSDSKFQSFDSGYPPSSTTTPTPNSNNKKNDIDNDDKMLKVETLEAVTSNGNLGVNGYSDSDSNIKKKELLLLLKEAALEAANKSHAPYSGSPSGVALMDKEGKIYKGSYMESAAYNPSLGPVQAALVAFVAAGGGGYDEIVEAVLVEKDGALVKQEQTARLLLQSISPNCHLSSFLCFTTSCA